ncbi:PAS domain-containing sensor histidine kinase [Flavobacterium degerlachei]|jgi:PAS domain S-box-containing protein|uniref:histidine kinase n=1 Tax=Flavobacterium degerlachei TaxID=229203 RepID=A0A1H3ABJ0_9FLAO|nr:PAS domain-containing sensor histidine kinase [Flavobacterium degerlachei]SDX26831.1 PAS domain S-box-containing protein [Flavobacterium degerlachei]
MTHKHQIYIEAAETAKIGIWESNLETGILYWDSVTKCILEVPQDFVPIKGSGINFFAEGENQEKIRNLLQKAADEGISFIDKFEITTAKNNTKYVECICRVEVIDNKVVRLLGTFQDITKEQNLIKKLELSVEKFSSVFSSANDAIIIINSATGIISDCNTRSYELTGYGPSELLGLHNSELFPIEKRKEIRVFLANQLKKDDHFVNETYIKSNNGTIVPVEVASGKKFIVDKQTFLVCFFRDISERKDSEYNLNMLSLVASETTDSIVIANSKGEAVWANNAYLKLTGYSLEETIGKTPRFLLNGPETNLQTIHNIRHAIENKKNLKFTILNYNKLKEKFWYESNITPVFDDAGDCIKFVCVGRDVTARVEKEIELKRILQVTSEQNNKLFNFAHIVSHNIRSHTSNLLMVLDVIENAEETDEKLSYFEMFKEGTEKLSETIEYLNEIITIQKNTNIEKKDVFLCDEIEKTKMALQLSIKDSQIEITHSIPATLTVSVIPAYLDSILLNLFTNAIKYRSHTRNPFLEIGYELSKNYTVITFKDNGLGIDLKKNSHKIFGMYKTFHGNDDARGIGLCITKNQIEAMKGKIEVESEEGIGSVFKVYINEK